MEEGLEEVVQAASALALAGFERPNFRHAGGGITRRFTPRAWRERKRVPLRGIARLARPG